MSEQRNVTERYVDREPRTREELICETAHELNGELYDYRTDPLVHRLIEERAKELGVDIENGWADDEALFLDTARQVLNQRAGNERADIPVVEWEAPAKNALRLVIDKAQLHTPTTATRRDVDLLIMPGGGNGAVDERLGSLLERIKNNELTSEVVIAMGSERPVGTRRLKRDVPSELEYAGRAAYSPDGHPAQTEFDLCRNGLAAWFGMTEDEWEQAFQGRDPSIPPEFPAMWQVSYAEKDGWHLFAVSAPMIGGGADRYYGSGHQRRRANTWDTLRMVVGQLRGQDEEIIHAAMVTDAMYKFQDIAARATLAAAGCKVETVYSTSDEVWKRGDSARAQEVLSLLEALRDGRDFLQNEEITPAGWRESLAKGMGGLAAVNAGATYTIEYARRMAKFAATHPEVELTVNQKAAAVYYTTVADMK